MYAHKLHLLSYGKHRPARFDHSHLSKGLISPVSYGRPGEFSSSSLVHGRDSSAICLIGFLTVPLCQIRLYSHLASEQNEWSRFYLHCFSGLIMNEWKVVRCGGMNRFCSAVALHKWSLSSHFSYTPPLLLSFFAVCVCACKVLWQLLSRSA